jgi:dynein heavy chain 1, cytosolic
VLRNKCIDFIQKIFEGEDSFVTKAIGVAASMKHVMDFTRIRVLEALFALLRKCLTNVIEYNDSHSDFPLEDRILEKYMKKSVMLAIMWGVGGSMKLAARGEFSRKIAQFCDVELPNLDQNSLIDYEVRIEDGEW